MSHPASGFLPRFLLLALVSGATVGMAKIVITLYALALGADAWQIGVIAAMEALGMLFLTLPAGFVIARFGARRVYALSSLGPMLVNLAIPLYAAWWWLALGQLLIGLFIPFRIVAMNGSFLRQLKHLGTDKAGWYRGALTLGLGLLGPLLGNAFSERGAFSLAFMLIAASFAGMALYSLRFWEGAGDASPSGTAPASGMLAQVRHLLGERSIRQSCTVELSNSATTSLFTTFIILLALEGGVPQGHAVSLVMIEALFAVLALFGLGRVLRSTSPGRAYALGLALAITALLVCGLGHGYGWLVLAAVLVSLATATVHLVNMARLSQRREDSSKLSGLFNLASMAGSFGGALLGGAISHFAGLANLFLCWIPLLLLVAWCCRQPRQQVQEVVA